MTTGVQVTRNREELTKAKLFYALYPLDAMPPPKRKIDIDDPEVGSSYAGNTLSMCIGICDVEDKYQFHFVSESSAPPVAGNCLAYLTERLRGAVSVKSMYINEETGMFEDQDYTPEQMLAYVFAGRNKPQLDNKRDLTLGKVVFNSRLGYDSTKYNRLVDMDGWRHTSDYTQTLIRNPFRDINSWLEFKRCLKDLV